MVDYRSGNVGKSITVNSNHFVVNFNYNINAFHYDVEMNKIESGKEKIYRLKYACYSATIINSNSHN